MRRARRALVGLGLCALTWPAALATAQSSATPPPAARIEVAAAMTVGATSPLGGATAALTPNTGGPAFTLFTADADYRTPLGAELRVSYRLAPWLLAGILGSVSLGDIRVVIGADAEGARPPAFTGERLGQASVEARIDLLATRWTAWRGRLVPYGMVSGGVFRQWHDDRLLIDTGSLIQAGAGARYDLARRPRRRLARLGAGAEVRLTRVIGGFHWGRERRTVPSARIELFSGWGQ